MHILIVGKQGVGKSTLISKILDELKLPVYGFITKKLPPRSDGACPVYIHSVGEERKYEQSNLVGLCKDFHGTGFADAFDAHSHLITAAPYDGVLLMDELGVMESHAAKFCSAVLNALDSHPLIVASVRDKASEFLNAVRAHKNAHCFYLTVDNREQLLNEILSFIKQAF